MSLNTAFYDEDRRCLVAHERVPYPRSSAGQAAIHMGLMLQQGFTFPGRYWVVWDDLDDLGVFPLHLVQAFGFGDEDLSEDPSLPDEAFFDRIRQCASAIS
jgi:hypothetical protein